MKGKEGSRARIYRAAALLGTNKPVGLTHRKGVLYHQVPFSNLRLEFSRSDLEERLNILRSEYKFEGLKGLDLGCAVGGLSFAFQLSGASMTGVERDLDCLRVASAIEQRYETGVRFVHSDIIDYVGALSSSVAKAEVAPFDFVFFFSAFNWVVEGKTPEAAHEFLAKLFSVGQTIFIDSALEGKGQSNLTSIGISDEISFLNFVSSSFHPSKSRTLGENSDWYGRRVYIFKRDLL